MEIVKAVRLDFTEDYEKRRVTRSNNWRVIDEQGQVCQMDFLKIGHEVRGYWSPDKDFNPARSESSSWRPVSHYNIMKYAVERILR